MNALHTFAHDIAQPVQELGKQAPAGAAHGAEPETVTRRSDGQEIRALDALAQCMVDSALGG
jgi:hypothetical protein